MHTVPSTKTSTLQPAAVKSSVSGTGALDANDMSRGLGRVFNPSPHSNWNARGTVYTVQYTCSRVPSAGATPSTHSVPCDGAPHVSGTARLYQLPTAVLQFVSSAEHTDCGRATSTTGAPSCSALLCAPWAATMEKPASVTAKTYTNTGRMVDASTCAACSAVNGTVSEVAGQHTAQLIMK